MLSIKAMAYSMQTSLYHYIRKGETSSSATADAQQQPRRHDFVFPPTINTTIMCFRFYEIFGGDRKVAMTAVEFSESKTGKREGVPSSLLVIPEKILDKHNAAVEH